MPWYRCEIQHQWISHGQIFRERRFQIRFRRKNQSGAWPKPCTLSSGLVLNCFVFFAEFDRFCQESRSPACMLFFCAAPSENCAELTGRVWGCSIVVCGSLLRHQSQNGARSDDPFLILLFVLCGCTVLCRSADRVMLLFRV